MNFKSTLTLLLLTVVGGGAWFAYHTQQPAAPNSPTLNVLQNELTADKLNRIEVQHGDQRLVLHRSDGDNWSLPGSWPTRQPEVKELVALLCNLRSRFSPLPVDGSIKLADYGLDSPVATVTVRAGDREY